MMQDINLFEELFLSLEVWGYFGVLAVVIAAYLLTKRDRALGIFFIIVESLLIWQYLNMEDYELYFWQVIILLLGVIQCMFRMTRR